MAIISNNVAKWIDPNFSLLEVLVANSMWRSHLKNLWRILCESCPSSKSFLFNHQVLRALISARLLKEPLAGRA